ncbi:MAG: hypothetical protein IPO21_12525 [Bacteroidales bacterium]|nr:hypothetical protein [Bacteroidales bacterium]
MKKIQYIAIVICLAFNISVLKAETNCNYTPGKSHIYMCSAEGVTIGGTLSGCGAYPEWSPTTGLENPYSVQTKAKPTSTTVYTLKIYDDELNLVATQSVTVEVDKSKIVEEILSSPECCFARGEGLNTSNLNITTVPPGLEENIKIEPSSVPAGVGSPYNVPVTLTNTCGDESLKKNISISAVDEDVEASLGTKYIDIDELVKKIDETLDKIFGVVEDLPKGPCEAKASKTNGLKVSLYKKCCKKNTSCTGIVDGMKVSGSVGVTGSFSCSFDIPYANVPYISTFYVSAGISASVSAAVDYKYECAQNEFCVSIKPSASLEIKAGYKALDGYLIDANIESVVGVEIKNLPQWCPIGNPAPSNAQICVNVTLEGTVTLLSGVVTEGFSYKLIQDKCKYLD